MVTPGETRTIEIAMDIDAAVRKVWSALTDPEQLRRWFPLGAEVQPGVGGSIRLQWGPELDGRNAIISWEPERHLQTSWFDAVGEGLAEQKDRVFYAEEEARRNLTLDFFLESKGEERTVLRMVHSGFSRSPEWDGEYDAHNRGWIFELRSLATYLGCHDGKDRHVAWVRQPISMPQEQAWSRLLSEQALLREGGLRGLGPGERYAITTVHGDRFEGEVILNQPPVEFAGTVENEGQALLRFGVEVYVRDPEATFWLSTWGDPERADSCRSKWNATFADLFG